MLTINYMLDIYYIEKSEIPSVLDCEKPPHCWIDEFPKDYLKNGKIKNVNTTIKGNKQIIKGKFIFTSYEYDRFPCTDTIDNSHD